MDTITRKPSSPGRALRQVHYVLSTHWDREWYQPFQVYRHRLVQLLDRTLDDIAAGQLRGPFTTDGVHFTDAGAAVVSASFATVIEEIDRGAVAATDTGG